MSDQAVALKVINGLLPIFREAGLTNVQVHYDGSGDSGCVEYISGEPEPVWEKFKTTLAPDGTQFKEFVVGGSTPTIENVFEALVWAVLEADYGGWEIDDGAFGYLRLDVATGHIELEHNTRYSDYNTEVIEITSDEPEPPLDE